MNEIIVVPEIKPLSHREALDLAATEYSRLLEVLEGLDSDAWREPTECPGWDVRTMVSHLVGAAESHISQRELLHQMRLARRHPPPLEDGVSAVQTSERSKKSSNELLDRLKLIAPKSVRARRRMPRPIRTVPIKYDGIDPPEWWKLGYLLDVIYTRDAWMHRIDICRATGKDVSLSPLHDGRIVTDVVAEWSRRHQKSFRLTLNGTAGGTFATGLQADLPIYELDAVEFCRILAGRQPDHPIGNLLEQRVPF